MPRRWARLCVDVDLDSGIVCGRSVEYRQDDETTRLEVSHADPFAAPGTHVDELYAELSIQGQLL